MEPYIKERNSSMIYKCLDFVMGFGEGTAETDRFPPGACSSLRPSRRERRQLQRPADREELVSLSAGGRAKNRMRPTFCRWGW